MAQSRGRSGYPAFRRWGMTRRSLHHQLRHRLPRLRNLLRRRLGPRSQTRSRSRLDLAGQGCRGTRRGQRAGVRAVIERACDTPFLLIRAMRGHLRDFTPDRIHPLDNRRIFRLSAGVQL